MDRSSSENLESRIQRYNSCKENCDFIIQKPSFDFGKIILETDSKEKDKLIDRTFYIRKKGIEWFQFPYFKQMINQDQFKEEYEKVKNAFTLSMQFKENKEFQDQINELNSLHSLLSKRVEDL
mmetsp:Transcript_19215/g.16491  ORF Transcript_19215/g.16491 Transcript_19215/m.16491 type:complete len:123 (-) Transcript_19215:77-445(-)